VSQPIEPQKLVRDGRLPFLVFEGLDGSGKSLTARTLADRFSATLLETPPSDLKPLRESIDTQAGLMSRFLYYLLSASIVSDEARGLVQRIPVVVDRYYYTTLASHRAAELEGDLEGIVRGIRLLEPDIVFCIDCSDEEERTRRLHQRGWTVNDHRFRPLIDKIRQAYRAFPNVVHIDTARLSPEGVVAAVEDHIRAHYGLGS